MNNIIVKTKYRNIIQIAVQRRKQSSSYMKGQKIYKYIREKHKLVKENK